MNQPTTSDSTPLFVRLGDNGDDRRDEARSVGEIGANSGGQAIPFKEISLGAEWVEPALPRNPLIALLYDDNSPQLLLEAQQGVLEAIRDTDYAMIVRPLDPGAHDMEQDLRHFLATQLPAGILVLPRLAEMQSIADICEQFGCPYMRLTAKPVAGDISRISTDDRRAAAKVVGHLIALGHTRIGIVSGPEVSGPAQQRELGYLDAIADHDLDRGPALIASGDLTFESGISAGGLLLEVSPSPTAIFAVNDLMAAGVIHAARVRGIPVPGQLSVIGFEDGPVAAHVWPQLSTVHVPVAAMACGAVFKMIYPDQADSLPSLFPLELVERGSVGPVAT